MSTGARDATPHPPFPPQAADRLLDLLSTDDAFRGLFTDNPTAALLQIGLSQPAVEAALRESSCIKVQVLASKQEIAAARAEIKEQLIGIGSHIHVHCFETGHAGHGI